MVADFAHGIQTSFLATMNHAKAKPAVAPAATGKTASSDSEFSFDDLLDIVNPLQHIPIVSTLYRKITGDTIKPLEKIAGDTLFGGLAGLGSSVADFAFQKITGKNLGDTVLAFVLGDDKTAPVAVAAAAPATNTQAVATKPPTPLLGAQPIQTAQANDSSSQALMAAAARQGISSDLALRALSAYQKSLGVPARIADAATQ